MAISCETYWDTLPLKDWESRFACIPRSNLLQSSAYAAAIGPARGLRARRGLVTIDGQEAGLVQILETGVFKNALHAVMLDRGPLWFGGFGAPAHIEKFFGTFNKEFPRRFGRRRRIIPEIPDTPEMRAAVKMAGFRRLDRPGYQTIWLALEPDTETLRANLKSSWRNKLHKAEKAELAVSWGNDIKTIFPLLRIYQSDKAKKGYDGPSASLLQSMTGAFAKENGVLAGRVMQEGETVAAGLFFLHGAGATYQAGWSTDAGRKTAAQNFLLWQAACELKRRGIRYFDLGGVNDESAHGVKAFKEGICGELVTLAGHYI